MSIPPALALVLLAAVASPASAQQASTAPEDSRTPPEWWADVNLASHHFGDTDDYLAPGEHFNQANYGLGVELQRTRGTRSTTTRRCRSADTCAWA
jgi:hypothetical protein